MGFLKAFHPLPSPAHLLGLAAALAFVSGAAAAQTPVKFSLDFKFEGPSAPFVAAHDRGYYEAEGLDVTYGGLPRSG